MDSTIVLMFGTVAAGIFLGFILGRFAARSDDSVKIDEAFKRGKEESDVEKANLTVALGEELLKLRSGIQSVAQAYESTVRVMHDRLGNSLPQGYIGGPGGEEVQLSLHFEPTEAEFTQTSEDPNIQSVRHSNLEDYDFSEVPGDESFETPEDDTAATMVGNVLQSDLPLEEPESVLNKNGHAN